MSMPALVPTLALILALVGCASPGPGAGTGAATDTVDTSADSEPVTCEALTKFCVNNDLFLCQLDGSSVSLVATCSAPNVCDAVVGACVCADCPDAGEPDVDADAGADADSEADADTVADGAGPDAAECPLPVIDVQEGDQVIAQTVLHLTGINSTAGGGSVASYVWTAETPVGASSQFTPTDSAPSPTFTVTVPGTYVFRLAVGGSDGVQPSCPVATATVTVASVDDAIFIELVWDTPLDSNPLDVGPMAGSDMDIHLAHELGTGGDNDYDGDGAPDPWFHELYDCFWWNTSPDWGVPLFEGDNGVLVQDDSDGAGPEIAAIEVPQAGLTYQIGVHHWNDNGYGASSPTVKIYIFGVLKEQFEGGPMKDKDFWTVAKVQWPSGTITKAEAPGGGSLITPNYPIPIFPQ